MINTRLNQQTASARRLMKRNQQPGSEVLSNGFRHSSQISMVRAEKHKQTAASAIMADTQTKTRKPRLLLF
jgi:hypothetical protein